jgi:NADH-quinone oxidoreductase subunit H
MNDSFDLVILIVKALVVVGLLVNVAPIMAWVERRGSALMQNRLGPNRIGPFGLFQSIADALKFIFKEDATPGYVRPFYYYLAPLISLIPAYMTFAVVPFAGPIMLGGKEFHFQVTQLDVGIVYAFAISSLAVYGIIMAGWASNSKYALFGSLRSTSQMVSYELSLGLSVIGVLMTFGSLKLGDIAAGQAQTLIQLGPLAIPKWGVFIQPVGFLIFLVASYAETNRLPFDLPEGESEIVAGYHLEYGAMKFALFMMAEYIHMTMASALVTTLFFGGYQLLPGMGWLLGLITQAAGWTGDAQEWARVAFQFASFMIKVAFFMWLYVWVRWTLPRFRYDQLMALGWKIMLPLSLANIFVTAVLIWYGVI